MAVLLAERGWSVRIHERAEQVREVGAGIFMHSNGLYVLDALGLMSQLAQRGVRLERARMRDERGRTLQDIVLQGSSTIWSFPRQALIEELHRTAGESGVEIVTAHAVESADPTGELHLADGTRTRGTLVVGSDGHRSRVRDSLGLTETFRYLNTTSTRYLLAGREFAAEPMTTEHWSGARRVALAACGPNHTYVYMACPARDTRGGAQPLDVDSWTASFPHLRPVFETLARHEPVQALYSFVRCQAWSKGRVVLLGDAAHAMAPTLGQAANLAMANAWTLAVSLDAESDLPVALRRWEHRVRWVTESTQRWATLYDYATKHWPAWLSWVRARVIWAFGASPYLNARLRVADHHPPNMLVA